MVTPMRGARIGRDASASRWSRPGRHARWQKPISASAVGGGMDGRVPSLSRPYRTVGLRITGDVGCERSLSLCGRHSSSASDLETALVMAPEALPAVTVDGCCHVASQPVEHVADQGRQVADAVLVLFVEIAAFALVA
jgi:hypothetical protein